MVGFFGYLSPRSILYERTIVSSPINTSSVASGTAHIAVDLGMLGCVEEAHSIILLLAENSRLNPSYDLTKGIPDTVQFLYEATGQETPAGVEKFDSAGLDSLEQELNDKLPYLADGVDVVNGNEKDYETLQAWIQELEAEDTYFLDATTGYSAMRLSSGLTGLLNLALHLQKSSAVTDEIMSRIASRIHANQQSWYLALIRPAWGKYFVSGWLRDKLGLSAANKRRELLEFAQVIHGATKRRLELGGPLNPVEEYKNKSMQEVLAELDQNTIQYRDSFGEYGMEWDDEDEAAAGPNTILHKPATPAQIAAAQKTIGRPLPEDLEQFYALTNGARGVVRHWPGDHNIENSLLPVEALFWEDDDYMHDYSFELFPGARRDLPIEIEWPGIEGGAIALYEHDGQGTRYLWYVTSELVSKARKMLEDAYDSASPDDKKRLDDLVKEYHGSWEKLRGLKECWYRQGWGDADSMLLFHDFRAFLSHLLSESVSEEDKNPLKAPKS